MFRLTCISALLAVAPLVAAAQQQLPLAPLPTALPRTHAPKPTTAAITAADLMTRLYIFADDSMQGRKVGMRGNSMGTDYLAAELQKIGLQPAGDSGTYFQNVARYMPILVKKGVSMRVGVAPVALTKDFIPIGGLSFENSALQVVYGGSTETPTTLTAEQAAGKLVVFLLPPSIPPAAAKVPHVDGAAAIAIVGLDSVSAANRAKYTNANLLLTPRPDQPVLLLSSLAARQIFGKKLSTVAVGTAGKQVSVAFKFMSSSRNVVAILPGSDPVLKNQYVAIGAHNDHIGLKAQPVKSHDYLRVYNHFLSIGGADTEDSAVQPTAEQLDSMDSELAKLRRAGPSRVDSIFNGADDDGSGSMAILEIAEYLAAMPTKPKRSIIFVWHTGEEAGLLGSKQFTQNPTIPRDSIIVQLNADMIGRGNASDLPGGGPNYIQVIGSRKLSTELGNLIDTVNKTGNHNFEFDYVTGEQYYTRSDHYMYARFGIPVAFFNTGIHPDYHQVTDEPQYIDYPKMARVASLMSDVALHVANLDHTLVVDQGPRSGAPKK